jgi:hypothetical protein
MRRSLALSWAFILLGPLLLSPGQAEKIALRFGPAVGANLTYMINGQVNVSGKNLVGQDISLNADSQGEIRIGVTALTQDTVRAGLTSSGIDVHVQSPNGNQSQTLRTVGGKALEVVFNRTGKVMDIRNPDVLEQQSLLNFSIPQILRDYFPTFPTEPVGPGDQWRESRRLSIPFQGLELQVNVTVDYVLNDIVPTPEGRRAVVSAIYSVAVSGSKDLGDSVGVFEGRGSGTGYVSFLADRGYFTEYRLDFKTDAAFVVKKGEKRQLEWPFSFSVLADVNLIGNQRP